MRKLMLTTEQWVKLKFTVELASIRARVEATDREIRAAKATGEGREAAVRRDAQFPADGSSERRGDHHGRGAEKPDLWKRWEVEPRPYGVAHGVPNRVDRLKCLGNAVVPQQAYPIFRALRETIFDGMEEDTL